MKTAPEEGLELRVGQGERLVACFCLRILAVIAGDFAGNSCNKFLGKSGCYRDVISAVKYKKFHGENNDAEEGRYLGREIRDISQRK